MSKVARRTHPDLWERVKAEVTASDKGGRPGQWSARKAQFAVAEYQRRGGGYIGPKSPDNALAKWTREKWRTRSGRPSLETGERYLPSKAIAALTPAEYAATSRAKRAGMRKGQQFVPQPERIAEKTATYRKNPDAFAASVVVIDKANRILVLRRSETDPWMPGRWDLPGGMLEPGEDAAHGASRELREEAGVRTPRLAYHGSVHVPSMGNKAIYSVDAPHWQGPVRLSHEHDAYRWVRPEELREWPITPNTLRAIRLVLTH